ncbi:MAG: HlyD family efflux transporter periplasmic adaptor subunit [Acidobacteria bacterium]|nr:HlyD family efflux transporter periplasmic adaptor subunit [Acidobacteriota bacterium]
MNVKRRTVIVYGLIVLALLLGYQLIRFLAQDNDNVIIRVSGNIEVTEAEVSFKIPGRVVERLVSEGEIVKAEQTVARLDDSELTREVALRQAEVQAAQAALAELEAGSRPEEIAQAEAAAQGARARLEELQAGSRTEEIAAAEAALEQAKAEAVRWQAEYERNQRLHEEGVISTQQLEAVRANFETSRAAQKQAEEQGKLVREGPRSEQVEQARAAWREVNERYAMIKAGPRKETIDQARARLEQAQQALAVAQTRLSYATLASPLAGVVLSENVEPGEYVAAGTPVVTVGNLSNVWLRAYINETDLGRVKVGQSVRVTTDTDPNKAYQGTVSFLSSQAEFTPRNVQTQQERVKLVYRVKIDIPNPQMELKPGMPADAEIQVTTPNAATQP